MTAYINFEDMLESGGLPEIASEILDDFPNLDIEVMQSNTCYLVLKVEYDEYEEIQELVGSATYMISAVTTKFNITINYNED